MLGLGPIQRLLYTIHGGEVSPGLYFCRRYHGNRSYEKSKINTNPRQHVE